MVGTKVVDELPSGLSLISDANLRTVNYDLGRVQPGMNITKEFTVRVTAEKDGSVIETKLVLLVTVVSTTHRRKAVMLLL